MRAEGKSFTFDPGGNEGEFGRSLLPMYLDITKFVMGWRRDRLFFVRSARAVFLSSGFEFRRLFLLRVCLAGVGRDALMKGHPEAAGGGQDLLGLVVFHTGAG